MQLWTIIMKVSPALVGFNTPIPSTIIKLKPRSSHFKHIQQRSEFNNLSLAVSEQIVSSAYDIRAH